MAISTLQQSGQLDLFADYSTPIEKKSKNDELDELLAKKSSDLLDALNDGLNKKEMYHAQYYAQHGNYIILVAANKDKDVLCNVVDLEGNTPEGFNACWRIPSHVRHELNLN